ncbi:MAG TPA: class I adenylate-forming enzyme family protein [Acidimicrobiales bacterium]|nr:class I adenylate-forming enzyme family protein [Acidimicrobiales bacterium]
MPTSREVEAMLTGPGGPFAVTTEEVRGIPMKVFAQRMHSLREIPALAQGRGDETFLVYGDRRLSFGEFIDEANSVSASLGDEYGVEKGDRVAVLSANNPEWCLAFWATVDLGAILVGLNGWWKADEILYGLEDSGAKVLVADRGRIERIAADLDRLPDLEAVFLADCDPADVGLADDKRVHRFDELLARRGEPLPDTPIDEDDYAVIFYTSGTTGRPKGAISTHRSMVANLQATIYNAVAGSLVSGTGLQVGGEGGASQAASLLTSPLFHVSGCHSNLVTGMVAGMKVVIPVGKFEPEKAMRLIQDERISVWATVPTMIWRVVEHPARHDYDLSSLQTIAYGGSPSAAELQRMIRETFPSVTSTGNAYGLTESSSAVTVNSGKDNEERPDSVGRAMPIVEIRIVGDGDKELAPGQTGDVQIRGPHVMPGYWRKPEATADTITADGWLRTGDVGHLDADGFLYITDRAKDMIIRGGENVYCVEIENRLVEHPQVLDAAVIGVAHPSLGEEVKAVVQVEPGSALTADEVKSWVAETLANFQVPAYVEFTTEKLPRNPSGKLLKNVLRGEGEVSFAETL